MSSQIVLTPCPPSTQQAPRGAQPEPAPRAAKRVCVLGDNALLARDTALQLRMSGYEVAIATEFDQLARLSVPRPLSCILVDPGNRDSRFADPACVPRIRAQCPAPVPVLWLAPCNNLDGRLAAARAGADGYLARPVQIGALKERIEALAGSASAAPYRVMVLGSDAGRLAWIEQVLSQAGIAAMRLQKPLDLLCALSRDQPEAIVIDVHTRSCNGVDLTTLIRQDRTFLALPVLVLSDDPDPAVRRRAVYAGADDVLCMPVAAHDLVLAISMRVERARALRGLITHDGMTGLYNHSAIKEQLVREIARSRRDGSPLALAMLDLDFFKQINDSHGHPAGDQVIRAIAQMLQQRLRHGDLVGRYGGEEFAVIMPGTCGAAAVSVLDEIRQAFAALAHRADETAFFATFSAGIAALDEAGGEAGAAALLRSADMALYRAKRAGRNRVEQG